MRLLVVEDEPRIASFIRRGLEEERHAVDVASDGDDTVLLATTNDYEVVLLDILLPRKNGLAVCRELRARNVTSPILMLTAKDSVEDKEAGLNTGADDYLTKPFAFDELLARVNALARRQSLDRSPLLCVGDLTLDPIRHEVRRGDATIELTNKEYALLALRKKIDTGHGRPLIHTVRGVGYTMKA